MPNPPTGHTPRWGTGIRPGEAKSSTSGNLGQQQQWTWPRFSLHRTTTTRRGPIRYLVRRLCGERHHAAHATAKHFMYDQGYTANIAPKNLYDTSASPIQQQPRCLVIHIQEEENWSTGRGPKPWWSTFSSQHWWEGTRIFFNILDIYINYYITWCVGQLPSN